MDAAAALRGAAALIIAEITPPFQVVEESPRSRPRALAEFPEGGDEMRHKEAIAIELAVELEEAAVT